MDPLEMIADSLILDGIRMAVDEAGGTFTEMPMTLDFAGAYKAVGELLHTQNHPTAIIGNRDEYCFFLLKALSAHGVRVPQDMALVGVNDGPFCELSNPALTSVGFDLQTSTANSIEAIDAIVHRKTPNPEWFIFPPPRLSVRESS
jgi:DNA-binding LacI/PurR family transcriptional regulator